MASFKIEFKRSADRDLNKVSPAGVAKIVREIEAPGNDPFPRRSLKLSGSERTYRLRVGVYRVIYEVDVEARSIAIYYIRHRREAYRRL